jgi:hypothetical protein
MVEFGTLNWRQEFTFDGTLFMVIDTARNGHRGRAMSLRGRMVTFHAIDMVKRP